MARTALALSFALAAPAMKDRRGRGWGFFFSSPSVIICTLFIQFSLHHVIFTHVLYSCIFVLSSLLTPCCLVTIHICCPSSCTLQSRSRREMFADESPRPSSSSSCRNYHGKGGGGGEEGSVLQRKIARRRQAGSQADSRADRSLSKRVCIISHSFVPARPRSHSLLSYLPPPPVRLSPR